LLGESPGIDDADADIGDWAGFPGEVSGAIARAGNDRTRHPEPLSGPDDPDLLDHEVKAVTLAAAGGENDD
jgi:hypothetical protein